MIKKNIICIAIALTERSVFKSYFRKNLSGDLPEDDLIEDYIDLAMSIEKKVDLKIKSYKKMREEHDRLAVIYRSKFTPTIKLPSGYIFLKLRFPPEYEMIKSKRRLVRESVENENCVAIYAKKINKGKCAIYSRFFNDKRYTIEIVKRRNKFILNQISGRHNHPAPVELVNEVKELLKQQRY